MTNVHMAACYFEPMLFDGFTLAVNIFDAPYIWIRHPVFLLPLITWGFQKICPSIGQDTVALLKYNSDQDDMKAVLTRYLIKKNSRKYKDI